MIRQTLIALTLWVAVPFVGGFLGYMLGWVLNLV